MSTYAEIRTRLAEIRRFRQAEIYDVIPLIDIAEAALALTQTWEGENFWEGVPTVGVAARHDLEAAIEKLVTKGRRT